MILSFDGGLTCKMQGRVLESDEKDPYSTVSGKVEKKAISLNIAILFRCSRTTFGFSV